MFRTTGLEPMTSTGPEGPYWQRKQQPSKEVSTMAASIPVEQESGMSAGRVHSHNGYYAGDFASPRHVAPAVWHAPIPAPFDHLSS